MSNITSILDFELLLDKSSKSEAAKMHVVLGGVGMLLIAQSITE
jgi:hypothetical protein